MDCGKKFTLGEYREELSEELWDKVSNRSCNRA
jgi:hypothetical protein